MVEGQFYVPARMRGPWNQDHRERSGLAGNLTSTRFGISGNQCHLPILVLSIVCWTRGLPGPPQRMRSAAASRWWDRRRKRIIMS